MNMRLVLAMCSYGVLALLAAFTLDGTLRYFVWILMAGLALKTYVAHKAGW
jgi:hypothetical protein